MNMPDPPNSLPAVLRFTRIVWAIFLFAQFMYISAGSKILRTATPASPNPAFTIGIAAAAVCTLCLALIFRIKSVRRASESLQSNPADATAIASWRKGQLITMILSETSPLFGLMLLTTGVPLNQVALFYAAGIAAMLFFFPKNPATM
jgi:hypothetical protein